MSKLNSNIHKITGIFNKKSFIFIFLRKILSIFLVPLLFSYTSNHIYSVFKSRSQFKENKHYPWLTYPSIEFLRNKDLNDKSVLEFGSGSSTIFFLDKGCKIKTFESELHWFNQIPKSSKIEKINTLVREPQDLKKNINSDEKFDLILIDGHERLVILEYVIVNKLLKDEGLIIFDNSEGYSLSETLKDSKYSDLHKVDFYGFSPGGSIDKHCTSIIFKNKSFIFNITDEIMKKNIINSPI